MEKITCRVDFLAMRSTTVHSKIYKWNMSHGM